jgi:hypothetical protein
MESRQGGELRLQVSVFPQVGIWKRLILILRYTTKAFGMVMAKAASLTIVEADNIVEVGEIDPQDVHLPGIYVDRIVPATAQKKIEILKTRENNSTGRNEAKSVNSAEQRRNLIARRAAKELKDGYYVNLGVGMLFIETRVSQFTNLQYKAFQLLLQLCFHRAERFGSNLKMDFWVWVLTQQKTRSIRKFSY